MRKRLKLKKLYGYSGGRMGSAGAHNTPQYHENGVPFVDYFMSFPNMPGFQYRACGPDVAQ